MSTYTESSAEAQGREDFFSTAENECDPVCPHEWGTPEDIAWRKGFYEEKSLWLKAMADSFVNGDSE